MYSDLFSPLTFESASRSSAKKAIPAAPTQVLPWASRNRTIATFGRGCQPGDRSKQAVWHISG
jgi:hypothetical protein